MTPRNLHGFIVKEIGVSVRGGLNYFSSVALVFGDRIPVFSRGPVVGAGSVEEPIALVGHESADVRDLAFSEAHLCPQYVRVSLIGDNDFGVGRALSGVMKTAVEVNLQGLRQDAGRDVSCLERFQISDSVS